MMESQIRRSMDGRQHTGRQTNAAAMRQRCSGIARSPFSRCAARQRSKQKGDGINGIYGVEISVPWLDPTVGMDERLGLYRPGIYVERRQWTPGRRGANAEDDLAPSVGAVGASK